MPYWEGPIQDDLRAGETVLVTAHGNSLRGLVKHLDGISDEDIAGAQHPDRPAAGLHPRRRLHADRAGASTSTRWPPPKPPPPSPTRAASAALRAGCRRGRRCSGGSSGQVPMRAPTRRRSRPAYGRTSVPVEPDGGQDGGTVRRRPARAEVGWSDVAEVHPRGRRPGRRPGRRVACPSGRGPSSTKGAARRRWRRRAGRRVGARGSRRAAVLVARRPAATVRSTWPPGRRGQSDDDAVRDRPVGVGRRQDGCGDLRVDRADRTEGRGADLVGRRPSWWRRRRWSPPRRGRGSPGPCSCTQIALRRVRGRPARRTSRERLPVVAADRHPGE